MENTLAEPVKLDAAGLSQFVALDALPLTLAIERRRWGWPRAFACGIATVAGAALVVMLAAKGPDQMHTQTPSAHTSARAVLEVHPAPAPKIAKRRPHRRSRTARHGRAKRAQGRTRRHVQQIPIAPPTPTAVPSAAPVATPARSQAPPAEHGFQAEFF
jgi:hypothetical protein